MQVTIERPSLLSCFINTLAIQRLQPGLGLIRHGLIITIIEVESINRLGWIIHNKIIILFLRSRHGPRPKLTFIHFLIRCVIEVALALTPTKHIQQLIGLLVQKQEIEASWEIFDSLSRRLHCQFLLLKLSRD